MKPINYQLKNDIQDLLNNIREGGQINWKNVLKKTEQQRRGVKNYDRKSNNHAR
jgi:hypothetical protein